MRALKNYHMQVEVKPFVNCLCTLKQTKIVEFKLGVIYHSKKTYKLDSSSHLSLNYDCEGDLDGENWNFGCCLILRIGEEQNREEGEMAQKKLGGGRNRGKK